MSKVNVSLQEVFTSPGNVLVTVKAVLVASQNVVVGTVGVLPGTIAKRAGADGRVVGGFDLLTGRYQVIATSASYPGLSYQVFIDVPDDNLTYEHTQLIVAGAAPFSQPIPATAANATDASYGLVKLATGAVNPSRVYTQAQADALLTSSMVFSGAGFVAGTVPRATDGTGKNYGASLMTVSAGGLVTIDGGLDVVNGQVTVVGSLVLTAGNAFDIGGWSFYGTQKVFSTADQSLTAQTTLQNATSLSVGLLANTAYLFRAELQLNLAAAVSGLKLGMTGPSAPTSLIINALSQLTVNTAPISAQNSVGAFGTLLTLAAAAFNPTTGLKFARIWGVIRNGANAGNLTVQFAQNVSDAGAVTMKAGSLLEVERLNV